MANNVRHGKRKFKQMSLEVAVRNPERYAGILKSFAKHEGVVLDDDGILKVYARLYIDEVVTTGKIAEETLTIEQLYDWIRNNCSHNGEWGFPTGYQAAFTRYLKTLSEFGFIYSQYNQPLKLSAVAKSLVNGKVTLSEAFALQSMRYWRMSPYRRVMNDFNFFEFIMDAMIELKERGHRLSINQFNVGLFSDDGNVDDFLTLLDKNKIGGDSDKAYALVKSIYDEVDNNHAKIAKQTSAFRDYGNTVFRVLQLTGFITVEYNGMLLMSPNENRIDFYKALKNKKFRITQEAKEDEMLYFEQLGTFDAQIETLVLSYREEKDHSTAEYNKKIENIIRSYGLTQDSIEQSLLKVSSGDNKGKDSFWFIQSPVKFEFLLTLYAYMRLGNKFIYKPNYICDGAGIPYSHAPGNVGDIEIYNQEQYWLIEATLIRSKNQQVNNETVNLFRHIGASKEVRKYITLVAPYIHDDTRLIFNVASIITMVETENMSLYSDSQTTKELVEYLKGYDYFELLQSKNRDFILDLREKLNSIPASMR
ncbi:MAG: AlwI family type II restriction endonuclease [Prevotella sp.]|uniref:AlwI family type II restriction endonuclease n=1 Tax=Prevotella sp. TaxID=59823 RepID=UPI002A2E696A|nr:AlwI family type II restriction endonuclease [Prevotella sp.]MDD7317937.1 AlwI family type II restriction endonuclease [Prevotellaceae bacterium]MDY4020828.1 AlwI family type II restriction endonuclease [Prevotella sp.]